MHPKNRFFREFLMFAESFRKHIGSFWDAHRSFGMLLEHPRVVLDVSGEASTSGGKVRNIEILDRYERRLAVGLCTCGAIWAGERLYESFRAVNNG